MENGIKYLDITIDSENVEEEIFPILKSLRPEWTQEDMCKESFSKGMVNKMACYYQKSDPDRNDAIVVRLHGYSDDGLNEREKEFMCLQVAQAAGCFPAVYATFNNGMVYKFSQGRMISYRDLVNPETIREVTRKLYQFHHIDVDSLSLVNRKGEPSSIPKCGDGWAYVQTSLDTIPEKVDGDDRDARFQNLRKELTTRVLQKKLDEIKNIFKEIDAPITLSHGDFHPFNIIYNEVDKSVNFIDYELSVYKYESRDLAGLFMIRMLFDSAGMIPKDDPDITAEIRLVWLRSYLEAMYAASGKKADEVPEAHVELLDVEHRIMQIAYMLELAIFFLSFAKVAEKHEPLSVVQPAWDKYCSMKDELPGLKKRYLEIKSKLPKVN